MLRPSALYMPTAGRLDIDQVRLLGLARVKSLSLEREKILNCEKVSFDTLVHKSIFYSALVPNAVLGGSFNNILDNKSSSILYKFQVT